MHDRLAVRGAARVAHGADAPVAAALGADDRVQQPRRRCSPRASSSPRHRVDEERQVVGVGLDHRAERLVAVLARASG